MHDFVHDEVLDVQDEVDNDVALKVDLIGRDGGFSVIHLINGYVLKLF